MRVVIIVGVVIVVLVALDGLRRLRRRGKTGGAVRGELVVTGVREQWRTGDPNDDKLNREYDVRLTVDATVTGAGPHRYDVTLVNRDVPRVVPGARFACDVVPSDPAVVQVYVRPDGPAERFEHGQRLDGSGSASP